MGPLTSGKSRLVKYYNLTRSNGGERGSDFGEVVVMYRGIFFVHRSSMDYVCHNPHPQQLSKGQKATLKYQIQVVSLVSCDESLVWFDFWDVFVFPWGPGDDFFVSDEVVDWKGFVESMSTDRISSRRKMTALTTAQATSHSETSKIGGIPTVDGSEIPFPTAVWMYKTRPK